VSAPVSAAIGRAWGPATFEGELRAIEVHYWDQHPLHRRMDAGQLRPHDLRAWVANRWCYQNVLPRKDAAIIANCPHADVRRAWVERIRYHDGLSGTPGEPGGRDRWLILAEGMGLPRGEVLDERHVVPGVQEAVDAYLDFARTRSWYEGVASSLTELFAPGAMSARMAAWRRHYPWIPAEATAYFEDRIPRAASEGAGALRIVLTHCRTREEQVNAVDAVRFKCSVLWAMADAIADAVRR
jgi:pyrroloquinoline-quinone synthase